MGNGKSKGKEMPYRQVKKKGYKNVTYSRNVVNESRLGYTEIPIHRPKFIFFEFQGLRANIPHWIFFGNVLVNKWCNTSFSLSDYTSAARTSKIKEPGDTYVNATSFPAAQGGPTNGGDNTELVSAADGSLKGLFYLQSNVSLNFPTNTDGTNFSALDVSVMDRDEALSYAATKFYGMGQYEDWYEHTTTEYETRREKYYYYETVYYDREHGRDGNYGGGQTASSGSISIGYSLGDTAQVDPGLAGAAGLGPVGGYSGITGPNSSVGSSGSGNPGGVCFAHGTLFRMIDNTYKEIQDIVVGDVMFEGGKVYATIVGEGLTQDWFDYNGVHVTGSHPVLDNDGIWKRVKHTSATEIQPYDKTYTLLNLNHIMVSKGNIYFTDYDEVEWVNDIENDAYVIDKLNEQNLYKKVG